MIGNLSKHKRNNDDTYRRSEIDLIVSNAKKSAVKYAEELAEKKLDKDENKGLSANDYTDSDKAEVAKIKDKVDKVSGKGLSTNDFTSAYKTKLDNLDTNISETLAGKADKTEVLTKTNTAAFTPTADYQPATKKYVDDLASNKGGGDMMKAVYDQDASGTVDDSDKLGGQSPSYYAKASDLTNKVDKVSGKGLSTNDYTNAEKAEVAKVKDKVDKVSGKGLSTNDFTSAYKTKLDNLDANLNNKVDKVTGKGLSKNDFTDDYKAKLDNLDTNLSGKVDKVSGKGLSTNDFTSTYKTKLDNLDTNLNNKVDKVSGKGLSTNDFTSTYKTKLDNLDSSLSAKAPAYSYSTTDLTAGTSALATGKLYFVYE